MNIGEKRFSEVLTGTHCAKNEIFHYGILHFLCSDSSKNRLIDLNLFRHSCQGVHNSFFDGEVNDEMNEYVFMVTSMVKENSHLENICACIFSGSTRVRVF